MCRITNGRMEEFMKKLQARFTCALALTLALVLGGCAGGKATGDAPQADNSSQSSAEKSTDGDGTSIVVGIPQDLEDSLDPHKTEMAGTREIFFNVFEGLVKPDTEGNLVDAVASSHTISEDHKTYTFTLREGVKFHNGADVTVDDVKYSIERCADASEGEPLVPAFSSIEKIDTPDEKTIEITLKDPDTEFLAYLTTAIIPKDYDQQDTQPVGTGPFVYVSRTPQDNIIMEKNEDYWGEPARLDKITFKVLTDSNAIVTNLKGGSVDMCFHLNATQIAALGDDFRIFEGTMNLVQALYLNNGEAPFDDVRVRQALCYAVDPQQVLDMVSDGKGTLIGSSMFPAFGKYYMPELADLYPRDVEKAKELLKEAGYEDGFEMTITVPSNYQQHVDAAQILAEQLKEISVDAKIELIEWDSWLSDVYMDRKYQSTVVGVDAATLTARAMLDRFVSDDESNFINFKNEEYDELFEKATGTAEDAEQVEYYQRMEEILAEDAANVYIQDMADCVAMSPSFDGYEFYPLYALDMSKVYPVEE